MWAFSKRNRQREVQKLLFRVINRSTPNLPHGLGEIRGESRNQRTIPVLLLLETGEGTETVYAITKDLSSTGLSIILSRPVSKTRITIGFWIEDEPRFLLGEVRGNVPLGGGFWQLGIQAMEVLSLADYPLLVELVPLVEQLAPQRQQENAETVASLRED